MALLCSRMCTKVTRWKKAAKVCDILQIPAFLSRQTFLIQAAAQTSRIINIRRDSLWRRKTCTLRQRRPVVRGTNRFCSPNAGKLWLSQPGGDFRSFPIMAESGFPIVYDVTHSLQRPSIGNVSGGAPEYASMMASAAIATGYVQGLFIETHPNPAQALSDAASMLPLNELEALLIRAKRMKETFI